MSLSELRGPVRALFTDLDGTMTSEGRLERETLSGLLDLFDAGLPVVLVTGRPAGWGHTMASLWPFAAAITENGGVSFVPEGTGFRKVFGVPEAQLATWRERMLAATRKVQERFPDAELSADSAYREVDLAIDWNEERRLPVGDADQIVAMLQEEGLFASRSSVHVNYGPPTFDKFSAAEVIASQIFPEQTQEEMVFIGDSLNDAPMFAGFANSVGVANVRLRWDELPHKPKYTTGATEGAGFCELVRHILSLSS